MLIELSGSALWHIKQKLGVDFIGTRRQLACLSVARISDEIGVTGYLQVYKSMPAGRCSYTREIGSEAFAVDRGPQPRGYKVAAASVAAEPRVRKGRVSCIGHPAVFAVSVDTLKCT